MEIKLKAFDTLITLSNDQLTNNNYVDLLIGDEEYTLSIDETIVALQAFSEIRARNHQHDLRCKSKSS